MTTSIELHILSPPARWKSCVRLPGDRRGGQSSPRRAGKASLMSFSNCAYSSEGLSGLLLLLRSERKSRNSHLNHATITSRSSCNLPDDRYLGFT